MVRRVIVAGSRNYTDWLTFRRIMDELFLDRKDEIEIVSGGARGPDQMAIRWARENSVPYKVFKADWDRYGRSAGYRRNAEMAVYAKGQELVMFWDGVSRGTRHMHDLAIKHGLTVKIFMVNIEGEGAKRTQSLDVEFDVLISRLEQQWVQEKQHHEQT